MLRTYLIIVQCC